jgi:hypothetical protein
VWCSGADYPWYHWLFYYEWEEPTVYEEDVCDVIAYSCEKACEVEYVCEPECKEYELDVDCHPYVKVRTCN